MLQGPTLIYHIHDMKQTDSISDSSADTSPAKQLHVHEWLAVLAIFGFLLFLTLVVIWQGRSNHQPVETGAEKLHFLKPQIINLYIDGAVAKPGSYQVKVGTLVKDVIAMAEPLPEADLRKIRPTTKARNGQSYQIPAHPTITVYLTGAVQSEGPLTVPKGTRLSELTQYALLKANADLEKINRKRYLKDNESINIAELK